MSVVRALVLAGFGINSEEETAAAYRLAGAETHVVHLARILRGDVRVEIFDVIHIPGGFSFGDDLGAGRALANRFRTRRLPGGETLLDGLRRVAADGGMVVGICNGFQVLVQVGLLPNVGGRCEPEASLLSNASGRFEDRWVRLRANRTRRPSDSGNGAIRSRRRCGTARAASPFGTTACGRGSWSEVLTSSRTATRRGRRPCPTPRIRMAQSSPLRVCAIRRAGSSA